MKTQVTPPKCPVLYMWDAIHVNTVAIWYPDGSSEYLDDSGEWVKGHNWFSSGIDPADIKICEIED